MAQTWLEKYSTNEDVVTGAATGITAFAGGGQASATALTSKFNNVTIVATNGDSVKLPIGLVGKIVFVCNSDAGQSIDVFPVAGEYMNGTINAARSQAAFGGSGFFRMYVCYATGYWASVPY